MSARRADSSASTRTSSAERNLGLYTALVAITWTPFFVPVLVLFYEDNGLDLLDAYVLQGLFAVAVVLLEVPTGLIADRLGKRTSLILGTALLALSMAGMALSTTFLHFLVAEVICALGLACTSGADSALLYDSLAALGRGPEFTRREGRARGLQLLVLAASALIGGAVAEVDLRAAIGLSVLGPSIGFFVALALREVAPPEPAPLRESFQQSRALLYEALRFLRKHALARWYVGFLAVLTGTATWLLWSYQPYMELAGMPVWSFGVAFASFNLIAAGASRSAGWVEERLGEWGSVRLLGVLQILPPLGMALFVHPASVFWIWGHQVVRGLSRPLVAGWLLRYTYADKRATVLSLASMAGRLLFAITGPLVGLATVWGLRASMALQGVGLVVLVGAVWWLWRRVPEKYRRVKASVEENQ